MKDLKTYLNEASLLDIDSQLDITDNDIDNTMLYNMIMSKDPNKIKHARNIIYNETISGKKLVRKSAFKENKVYIQFFNKDDFKDKDAWGFRIGTCNPIKEDTSHTDIIFTIPSINSNTGIVVLYGDTQQPLKMYSYLKRATYELPNKYLDLYKKLAKEELSKRYSKNLSLPKIVDEL